MPDTPRFDDPQNLVIAALIDLYGRGLVPLQHTVSSMSIVVDYIQRFDQQTLDPAWLAQNVSRLDSLVLRLLKSLLLELTQLDFLSSFVDASLCQMGPKSGYARKLGPNSLVGGFFKDILTHFLAAEFDVRIALWHGLCDYVKTFGVPETSEKVEQLPDIICANDTFRAIDVIHKQSDFTRATPDAMNIILRVLAQGGYVSETFALAESALVAVRMAVKQPTGRKTMLQTLAYMGRLMLAYPRLVPANFVISLDSLMAILRSDSEMTNSFWFLTLELFYLLSQGAPLPVLVEKMAPMVDSCFSQHDQTDKDRRKLVHHLSFLVWSRHGKTELAQIHLDMIDKIGEPVYSRFALLAQEALQRDDPEAALAKLETLRPNDNCTLQSFNLARLVLRVLSLTRAQKFAAAAEVLKVVHAFPMELEEAWVFTIKCTEIQLLLAQQKTQQALELAQENLESELPLHRVQLLVYSARALCEYPLRRFEALELAKKCVDCNSVPLAVEAQVIEACALSFGDAAEVAQALEKCTALAPTARSLSPRLLVDVLVTRAMCLVSRFREQQTCLEAAVAAYNEAQIEINRELVLSHVRQMHNLRTELLKETNDLVEPTAKSSVVEKDLKRKLTVWERRPSKRRSLNA